MRLTASQTHLPCRGDIVVTARFFLHTPSMRSYVVFIALILSSPNAQAVFWDYEGTRTGQEEWGNLTPNFATCRDGKSQSPISLNRATTANLPVLQFDYKPTPSTLWLDRYSVVSIPTQVLEMKENGHAWRLKEMLIRTPSEHDIDGNYYPMELQFIHENDEKKPLIIAIFLKIGQINPALQGIIDHFPRTLKDRPTVTIDWTRFIPGKQAYYRYNGSFAYPPCTEGVEIIVFKTPVEASKEQLSWLAGKFNRNARNPQPLLMRSIQESK